MENGILRKFQRVPDGQQLQFRKRLLLFSVFLLISVFIWLLNAMSKNYTSDIEYPLVYTDLPEGEVFVGEMPRHLDLRINAHGYALLRYKLFRKPAPISFKVSAFNLNPGNHSLKGSYILTRYLKDQIAGQLPPELQLLEIKPDTLFFQFDRRVRKMFPVRADLDYEIDKQFTIKDQIKLEPDSIEVSGPSLLLDTLQFIPTEVVDLGVLTKDYSNKIRIRKLADLEYNQSRVTCTIELERFTERQISLPLEVLHLPDSLELQTFPSKVKITCRVGLSNYDRVASHPFRAVVDFEQIDERTSVLNVRIENQPDYLLNYEYNPKMVEYLLLKK